MPSGVSVRRRVVRWISLTPSRASSESSRRPIIAGASPSCRAAALRLPRCATLTKVVISLNGSIVVSGRIRAAE